MKKQFRDWSLLRTFLEIARVGSIQAAAERLGRSRPTVANELLRLEREAGCALLIRTPHGVDLTEAGQRVLKIAEGVEDKVETLRQAVSVENQMRSTVRYRGPEGFGGYCLPHLLEGFNGTHPNITVELQCGSLTSRVDLSRREADFTMMYSQPTDPDLSIIRSGSFTWALCASNHYIERHGCPTRLEELAHHSLLVHEIFISDQEPWSRVAGLMRGQPRIALKTASMLVLVRSVLGGIGIGMVPRMLERCQKKLVFLPIEEAVVEVPYWLVCHAEVRKLPSVRAVLDHLKVDMAPCFPSARL